MENSSSSKTLGSLVVLDQDGNPSKKNRRIGARHGLVIGRDAKRCHWVFQDPHMSLQHLHIYTVMPSDDRSGIEPRVCVEDISRNGVYWNGTLIGNKSDAFLLSDGDRLRLTSKTTVRFESSGINDKHHFSTAQKKEMREFWNKYVITDKLLDTTAHSRTFMAIEQTTQSQIACEVITLERPVRNIRPSSIMKRPRSADSLGFQHEVYAVKSWISDRQAEMTSEERVQKCFRISQSLHSIKHPNLLGLEKIFATDETIYVFQDLIPAGNLLSYVNSKNGKLLEVEAAVVIRQILHAVQALHDKQFFHRNIRSASILVSSLSKRPRFVLSSFEMARKIIDHRQTRRISGVLITEDKTVPQYLTDAKECAEAEDLRCIGATAAFLLTGSDQLYYKSSTAKAITGPSQYLSALEILPNRESLRSEAMQFIDELSRTPSLLKPSAQQALEHIWFSPAVQNADVQKLCELAVRKWRPTLLKDPFIDFVRQKSRRVQEYDCSQQILEENRPSRGRSPRKPVEPPYKPFYREVYNLSNAGERGGRMPRDKASTRLRELSANWVRSMPSSPLRTRTASASKQIAIKHNPDEAENSFQTFRAPERARPNQPMVTTLSERPKLARQLSFRQQMPDSRQAEPLEEESISEKSNKNVTSVNAAPSSPIIYRLSRGRTITAAEDASTPNAAQEHSGKASVQYISGSRRRLKSPMQSSAQPWALNVRSESKLNARTRSRSRSLPAAPKPGKQGTLFRIADENNDALVTPVATTWTRNDVFQNDSIASGVTPHLAHLRLVQPFE